MKNGFIVFLTRKNKITKSSFKIKLHELTCNSKKFASSEEMVNVIESSFYK